MKIRKNKYRLLPLFLCILLFTGCKVQIPKEVIPEKEMEDLLYDYHIAKAMGEGLSYNENYKKVLYTNYVYKKHGVTEAEFDSSLVWYTRYTDVLADIYDRVNKRVKKDKEKIEYLVAIRDNKPLTSKPGDSINLWWWEHLYKLSEHPLGNKLSFTIPSDSNFSSRDTLVWALDYLYLGAEPDSLWAAVMSMQILYSKDSIISETKKVMESGRHAITLQADSLGDIKNIKGFVYYPERKDSLSKLLLKDISLMRYHSTDTLSSAQADTIATEVKEEKPAVKEETPKEAPQETEKEERARPMNRPRPSSAREAKPVEMLEDIKENVQ